MAKQKKKRNKVYAGQDAAVERPVVTRVAAVDRSPLKQWWFERKDRLRPIITIGVVAIVVILIVVWVVQLATGH